MSDAHSAHSSAHSRRPLPPAVRVVTDPPWARDEPPSPQCLTFDVTPSLPNHLSDGLVSTNSLASHSDSRWWTFTLPRPTTDGQSTKKQIRNRTIPWIPTATADRASSSLSLHPPDPNINSGSSFEKGQGPRITLQVPPAISFTKSHNSPGWDSPWTSRPTAQGPINARREHSYGFGDYADTSNPPSSTPSYKRKTFRSFLLTNVYVPLFFRFSNIAFTGAALGMAIRIRQAESHNGIMGAIGSSPTVVIIFAPLTLVHVMAAIYLEYFGRPLGLWRTSAKLAHTLSEVLFICAWSAALSLCFDNFFTSLIPCASPSSLAWYSHIPRPPSFLPAFEDSFGDLLCDSQLSLICLVGVGLMAYCTNLIISLFRIFEKVKYHPGSVREP